MIDIEIEDLAWTAALPQAEQAVLKAARAALAAVEAQAADVDILLADDGTVAELNLRFRQKPGPTNVLSFPSPETARPHLGDIVLAFGVCSREASEQGKKLEHHLMHLVAHGVLHLVGYDHQNDAEAESMEALERQLMQGLGAPDPYEAGPRTGGHAG
jgi:probable rRNA maturation factor